MKWLKWLRRAVSIVMLLVALAIAAWIFWPTPQPSEQQLLAMVPNAASAVMVQRGLGNRGPALHNSAFFKACCESPFMPIGVAGDSQGQRAGQQALFDLLGDRFVLFLVPGGNGVGLGGACVLTPITPRSKWVWLRVMLAERLHKGGFQMLPSEIDGHAIHEVVVTGMPIRLRYAIKNNALALAFDGPGDSLASLLRPSVSSRLFPPELPANAPPGVLHLGSWRQGTRTATWTLSRTEPGRFAFELTLPKQRTVRLPWDDSRGPRTMALIQKLFPDQGLLTLRGRASHLMSAWDNVIAWLGLSSDLYSETLLMRTKYREHLSHGQFPWSGAGDELACVIAPSAIGPATITFALRCWEPTDTQMAVEQFLPSLTNAATGTQFSLEKSASVPNLYSVRMESGGQLQPICHYRYVDGLVIASNSLEQLQKFDPAQLAEQQLQPSQPENQLYCKADELAKALGAMWMLAQITGNASASEELQAALSILKTLSELRLTIRSEKDTVNYLFEARPL